MTASIQRQVWRTQRAGSLKRLRLEKDVLHPPELGEARVRVHAIGLNFADIFALLGLYSATPKGAFVPGLEFAGVIEDLGPKRRAKKGERTGGPALRKGTRVMGVTRFGGYTTHLNVDTRYLQPLPNGWDFAEGAALLAQGLTAYYALYDLGTLEENDTVLVHSAAGGVGLQALALIKKAKATAIATVGSEAKVDVLMEQTGLAREQIIVRDAKQFPEQLDAALGFLDRDGFDLILDSVAGRYLMPGYDRLLPAGRLVVFGAAMFMTQGRRPNPFKLAWRYITRPKIDPLAMMSENKAVLAFNLIWLWDRIDLLSGMLSKLLSRRIGPPFVGHRFAFADAHDAIQLFQSGQTVGKVVLEL